MSHIIQLLLCNIPCLDGGMVDTRHSKCRAKQRGGSSPLQGIRIVMPIK